jgi:hypothetical protein
MGEGGKIMRLQPLNGNRFSQWEIEEMTYDRAHGYKISALPLKTAQAKRINWRYNIALFIAIALFLVTLIVTGNLLERLV